MKTQGLRGKNIIELHEKVAREYAERLKKKKGVLGIVCLGSLGRGYADKFSDIDMTIFVSKGARIGLAREGEVWVPLSEPDSRKYGVREVKIDWTIVEYEKALKERWDPERKWAYSQHRILYDPQKKIERLIKKKTVLSEKERKWLLMEGLEQSHYFCVNVPEKWVRRGDILAAHHCFCYGIDMLLQTLFALNKTHVPADPWRLWCARRLEYKPRGFEKNLREMMIVKELSKQELERRKKAFLRVWKNLKPVVEKEVGRKWEDFKRII